jgi:hypothetical protein
MKTKQLFARAEALTLGGLAICFPEVMLRPWQSYHSYRTSSAGAIKLQNNQVAA